MKVIVSHDIDHFTFWEHRFDFVIHKFVIRHFLEMTSGQVTVTEFFSRMKNIIKNQWHNLEDLMLFDKSCNVPATFFIGVSNGKGLVYSLDTAEYWVKKIIQEGFDVGVHGIAFDNYEEIKREHIKFKRISGKDNFGIRMHYLRYSEKTLEFLSRAGYLFDTTLYQLKNPYLVSKMWEFPLFMMDVYIFRKESILQNQSLEQVKDATMKTIDDSYKRGFEYFTINLHDIFFNDSFSIWKKWYIWLINYCITNKIEFSSYSKAIRELENKAQLCPTLS